jgi:hypothetical protein
MLAARPANPAQLVAAQLRQSLIAPASFFLHRPERLAQGIGDR